MLDYSCDEGPLLLVAPCALEGGTQAEGGAEEDKDRHQHLGQACLYVLYVVCGALCEFCGVPKPS
jgi:hypothetical protein